MTEKTTSKKGLRENLKQYAYLNSVTALIDHFGVQLTGFIINPFIVNGLGSSFYGIWQMLTQITGYANMADTRATQVLKWSISKKRDISDPEELQSEVSSALVITFFIVPIIMIIGSVIVWYAPYIADEIDPEYYSMIRITCSLLILSLLVYKVFDLFESVLRGMNLGFKRMGFRAGIVAIGGLLKVGAIYLGYGLIGLASVQVMTALIMGFTFYYIVKKHIPWFAFGKTNKSRVKSYGKVSGWFMAYTGTKMMMLNSDKILLGYLIGPVLVTQYTLTLFVAYAIRGIISSITDGIIPGIGGILGKGEFDKVKKARSLLITINWVLVTTLGIAIVLFNKSFIGLWVGDEHYAGDLGNLLILLTAIQYIFFQMDSSIINISLKIKSKVFLSLTASAITILLAIFLVKPLGIVGLCISIILGRSILSIGFPMVLNRQLNNTLDLLSWEKIRPFLISNIMLCLACYLSQWVLIQNWFSLFIMVVASIPISILLIWYLGISQDERKEVLALISNIKFFKGQ